MSQSGSPPSSENCSSIPSIISWLVGVAIVLLVGVKLLTKYCMRLRFAADDATILVSLILSAGLIVSISLAAANGLGKHASDLTSHQLDVFQKTIYASDLIYPVTLTFSKVSMMIIFSLITPSQIYKKLFWGQVVLLSMWTLSSVLVLAFQCQLPTPWAVLSNQCVDRRTFWTYFAGFNIFTELCLVAVAIPMIARIRMDLRKKGRIATVFGLRLITVGIVAVEIYFIQRVSPVPNDTTFTLWPVWVCRQLAQGSSIVFACTPFLQPFFNSLNTGMTRVDDERRRSELVVSPRRFSTAEKTNSKVINESTRRLSSLDTEFDNSDSRTFSTARSSFEMDMDDSIKGSRPSSVLHIPGSFHIAATMGNFSTDSITALPTVHSTVFTARSLSLAHHVPKLIGG